MNYFAFCIFCAKCCSSTGRVADGSDSLRRVTGQHFPRYHPAGAPSFTHVSLHCRGQGSAEGVTESGQSCRRRPFLPHAKKCYVFLLLLGEMDGANED